MCLWWGSQMLLAAVRAPCCVSVRIFSLKNKQTFNVNFESFKGNWIFSPLKYKRGSVLNVNKLLYSVWGREETCFIFLLCRDKEVTNLKDPPQPSCSLWSSSTAMGLQHNLSGIKILWGSVIFLSSWLGSTLLSPTPLITHSLFVLYISHFCAE